MSEAIHWDPTGRPYAKCPACGAFHPINRRQDYLSKPVLRFQCRNDNCSGMTWRATDEDRQRLLEYFAQHQGRRRGRPAAKVPEAKPTSTEPTKRNIWDKLL